MLVYRLADDVSTNSSPPSKGGDVSRQADGGGKPAARPEMRYDSTHSVLGKPLFQPK